MHIHQQTELDKIQRIKYMINKYLNIAFAHKHDGYFNHANFIKTMLKDNNILIHDINNIPVDDYQIMVNYHEYDYKIFYEDNKVKGFCNYIKCHIVDNPYDYLNNIPKLVPIINDNNIVTYAVLIEKIQLQNNHIEIKYNIIDTDKYINMICQTSQLRPHFLHHIIINYLSDCYAKDNRKS